MSVVTIAITINIVKASRPIRPRSRPIFSTISSTSPRVFIKTPTARELRHDMPAHRAPGMAAATFPTIATSRIRSRSIRPGPATRPRWC